MISDDYPDIKQCGVEQLVARRAHNPKVISSSLVPATKESMAGMLVAFNGPLVYRLGRQIFILEIGVRFPCGLLDGISSYNLNLSHFSFYPIANQQNEALLNDFILDRFKRIVVGLLC